MQGSAGIVADSSGNAGYYVNGNGGLSTGGGFKFAGSGAVSTAPTINDLNGQGAGVSAVAGLGAAASIDWSKGSTQAGQTYNSYGASVGVGAGGGVSAGPSYTAVWCQVGPNCGSTPAPAPTVPPPVPTVPSPTSLNAPGVPAIPASFTPTSPGGAAPGLTGSANQPSSLK